MYSISNKVKKFSSEYTKICTNLRREVSKENIQSPLGLGFVIYSKDRINVVTWNSNNSSKQHPKIYNKIYTPDLTTRLDTSTEGAFTMSEIGILTFESNAMETKQGLNEYIKNVYTSGDILLIKIRRIDKNIN